jgi:hypothetical protein
MFGFLIIIVTIVSMLIFGGVCSNIAENKGHYEARYFFYGFFFGIIGLAIVLLVSENTIK